jgi:hypothetical protein
MFGSIVVEALCYKADGRGFEIRSGELILSIFLILPAALGFGVYSASIRSRKIMFLGNRARLVLNADNLTTICEPIV